MFLFFKFPLCRTYVRRTKIKIKMEMCSRFRCDEMYFIFWFLLFLCFTLALLFLSFKFPLCRTYVRRTKIKIKMKMYSPSRCGEMYFIFGILLCLRFAFFHWHFRCVVRTYVGQRLKRITFWCFLLLSVFEFGVISCFSDVWFGFRIVRL